MYTFTWVFFLVKMILLNNIFKSNFIALIYSKHNLNLKCKEITEIKFITIANIKTCYNI